MDDGDYAQALFELHRKYSLDNHFQRVGESRPSLSQCQDCDGPIEDERQQFTGITRCAECQGYADQEKRFRCER